MFYGCNLSLVVKTVLFTDLLVYHERVFVLIYIKELCSGVSFILNESDIDVS